MEILAPQNTMEMYRGIFKGDLEDDGNSICQSIKIGVKNMLCNKQVRTVPNIEEIKREFAMNGIDSFVQDSFDENSRNMTNLMAEGNGAKSLISNKSSHDMDKFSELSKKIYDNNNLGNIVPICNSSECYTKHIQDFPILDGHSKNSENYINEKKHYLQGENNFKNTSLVNYRQNLFREFVLFTNNALASSIFFKNAKLITENPKKILKNSLKSAQNYCVFCDNNNEQPFISRSHCVRDTFGRTTCPILRSYVCPICGQTGDDAHTVKYCPKKRIVTMEDIISKNTQM